MLIFKQLFDQDSSTYTYLLGDSEAHEAILIDAVFEQTRRDLALLNELDLKLVAVLDTHCHADHITSAWALQQRAGATICISAHAGVKGADRYLNDGDLIKFGKHHVEVFETPGHTDGCLSYVLDDHSMAFTGDALLIRGCGRTDFQQGSAKKLYQSIKQKLFSLADDTRLYPGHDYHGLTVTSVAEEKAFNPRFGGNISETDFVGYMDNLELAHPRKIDEAVPANLRSGRPESGKLPDEAPGWAPLTYTFAGVWEIEPQWLEEHGDAVTVLDVREDDEFNGPLGHLANAQLIPLGKLSEQLDQVPTSKPIVTVCRAGGRSAQATVILNRSGFTEVANLAGGMLRWRAQSRPVEGGTST